MAATYVHYITIKTHDVNEEIKNKSKYKTIVIESPDTHGHHKKYANVFDDGQTFKMCYESKIEKYVMEFEPFDISLELKKYKINKRKRELENDFKG